ncbi:MAG: hypothetical protein ABWX74_05140 [Aeromicrobium sp.]
MYSTIINLHLAAMAWCYRSLWRLACRWVTAIWRIMSRWMATQGPTWAQPSDRYMVYRDLGALVVLGLAHAYWRGVGFDSIDLDRVASDLIVGQLVSVLKVLGLAALGVVLLMVAGRRHWQETARDCAPTATAIVALLGTCAASLCLVAIADADLPTLVLAGAAVLGVNGLVASVIALFLAVTHKLRVAESVRGLLPVVLLLSAATSLIQSVVHISMGDLLDGYPPVVGIVLTLGGPVSVLYLALTDLRYLERTGGAATPRTMLQPARSTA